MQQLLVTGLSGLVGSAFRADAEGQYQLRALNRSAVAGIDTVRASLDDEVAVRPAFDGVETVVHLAAKISDSFGWEELHKVNVLGTRNVLEAACDAGVRRVVFVSSGATVAGWEKEEPYRSLVTGEYGNVPQTVPLITEQMATRPANLYAATKVWGEAIARHYADNHGLEVICLRIGYANEEDRPSDARQRSVWNSQRDVVQAINRAIAVELPSRFETFFILSENRYAYRSLVHAREHLGFVPEDSADSFFGQ